MTSATLQMMLKALGLLGAGLVLGTFLRANVKIFQKTFIPAGVIGGVILLIIGPNGFGLLPESWGEWFTLYNLMPSVLLVPVVAGIPLGLKFDFKGEGKDSIMVKSLAPLLFIGSAAFAIQYAIGYGTQALFSGSYDFYTVFGLETGIGFVGGHGTAGNLAGILQDLGQPYWEVSQGVATTTATFGMLAGIIFGIVMINVAARKGATRMLDKPADIPEPLRIGFHKNVAEQSSAGRQTTLSASIDVIAFHAALIFIACGIAYFILGTVKKYQIPVLVDMSAWVYAMLVMFVIWGIICKMKVDYLVDANIKSKITNCFTEFAVIAAIASVPIQAVAAYIVPILVMCFAATAVTIALLVIGFKYSLGDYWFEQTMCVYGMATGNFLTGALLLRVCDPDLKSPALSAYSLMYSPYCIFFLGSINFFALLAINHGAVYAAGVSAAIAVALTIGGLITGRLAYHRKGSAA